MSLHAMATILAPRAISGTFNGLILTECIVFGIATVLFLFYFNRVFAFFVSLLINTYTWTFYRVTFRAQAIQVSPLGGRIFFKGICYQGQNETILVHDGYVTWRYWFRRVRRAGALRVDGAKKTDADAEGVGTRQSTFSVSGGPQDPKGAPSLPCRIEVKLRGLEWFVYNRSPAYDTILSTLLNHNGHKNDSTSTSRSNTEEKASSSSHSKQEPDTAKAGSLDTVPNAPSGEGAKSNPSLPIFLESLPIRIYGSRAAMVMGNHNTRVVLVAKIRDFDGRIDAQTAGSEDLYRQCFDFEMNQGTVSFKHNHEYTGSQLEEGAKLWNDRSAVRTPIDSISKLGALFAPFERGFRILGFMNPFSRQSRTSITPNNPGAASRDRNTSSDSSNAAQSHWMGLSRYLADDAGGELATERWRAVEYARVETIADLRSVNMSFFWDVPGRATSYNLKPESESKHQETDHVNGTEAPSYGLDVDIGGGTVNYGPWADRQRANLQSVFFPSTYSHIKAATRLSPGEWRISTVFKMRFALSESIVLRVHTREASKDWRWKDRAHEDPATVGSQRPKNQVGKHKSQKTVSEPATRAAGWLDVTVAKDSSVIYCMDMLARKDGYHNRLELDVKSPRISTSVNHDLLCRASTLEMQCDLSNPRQWRALHTWLFGVSTSELELFLLRDHAFLLQDLINDWTSGPSNNFYEFVPFLYVLKLQLPQTKVYLNVNDSNIINNPSSVDDNSFLIIGADRLDATLDIPLKEFEAPQSRVGFDSKAQKMTLDLSNPQWATQRTLLDEKRMANLDQLTFRGSYNYYSATAPSLTDTVFLHLEGSSLHLTLFGFLVRYFMNFKENYFGEDLHFQTQDEFQKKLELSRLGQDDNTNNRHVQRPTNDLDVVLTVVANGLTALLPSRLYSRSKHVRVDTPIANLDLRFTNYYMDMQGDFSPLSFSMDQQAGNLRHSARGNSNVQLFIDGASIVGHRLFGLPPTEPTYVCNWDFDIGNVSGEVSLDFMSNLIGSAQSFASGFPDKENSIGRLNPLIIRDVIFLRAKVQPVRFWIRVEDAAFLISSDQTSLNFNDWAVEHSSERLELLIPYLACACIDTRSISKNHSHRMEARDSYTLFETSVNLRLIEVKHDFSKERQQQQEHIIISDSRTHRTPWLICEDFKSESERYQAHSESNPPAMPFPPMPAPLHNHELSFNGSEVGMGPLDVSHVLANGVKRSEKSWYTGFERPYSSSSEEQFSPVLCQFADPGDRQDSIRSNHTIESKSPVKTSSSPTTSGPFTVPHFPLMAVKPNSTGLPALSQPPKAYAHSYYAPSEVEVSKLRNDKKTRVLIVRFGDGIRALLTPEAVFCILSLVDGIQPRDPDGILDGIQTSAMSHVLARGEPSIPQILELQIGIPEAFIRLRDQRSFGPYASSSSVWSDFHCQAVECVLRSDTFETGNGQNERLTGRFDLGGLDIEVVTVLNDELEHKALSFRLGQTTAEVTYESRIWATLNVQNIGICSLNRDTKVLAALINQAIWLTQSLATKFESDQEHQSRRSTALIRYLSTCPKSLPEAPFMTTTSFTLRTSKFNPRNSDSWKLISRLRWVLQHFNADERLHMSDDADSSLQNNIHDAEGQILSAFNHWRGWDLEKPAESFLMTELFGKSSTTEEPLPQMGLQPMHIAILVHKICVTVDPGPKEDSLAFETISCVVSNANYADNRTETNGERHEATTTIALFCKSSSLSLRWEMVELMAGLSKEVDMPKPKSTETIIVPPKKEKMSPVKGNFHVVATFEQFSTRIESLNLESVTRCFGVTGSVALNTATQTEALTIYSSHVISEVSTQHESIVAYKLQRPNVQMFRQSPEDTECPVIVKVGGFCENLELHVTQDLLGIIGVLDRVLSEEISFIQGNRTSNTNTSADQDALIRSPGSTIEFHALLLLDSYNLSAKVLSTLQYSIQGMYARSSCDSVSGETRTTSFDFDIDTVVHTFTNYEGNDADRIACLSFPPVNGQMKLKQGETSNSVDVAIALEPIKLDASAIHALFTTYSRREISTFRDQVIRDAKYLQVNFENVFGGNKALKTPSPSSDAKKLLYRAHFVAAGLKIRARTGRGSSYSARLTFELGSLNFKMHNVEDGKQLDRPEMSADLQPFRIFLKRFDGNRTYRCGDFSIAGSFLGTTQPNEVGQLSRSYETITTEMTINIFPETASTIVDIIGYLQQRFKSFNLSEEINTLTIRARRLRAKSRTFPLPLSDDTAQTEQGDMASTLFSSMFSIEMNRIFVAWHVGSDVALSSPTHDVEDLQFSILRIHLSTKKSNSARLTIQDLQLQMAPRSLPKSFRSKNSALLPDVAFNVAYLSTSQDRRLAFQAIGKTLDLRLTAQSPIPAVNLQKSIALATRDLRKVVADWNAAFMKEEETNKNILGNKTLSSVLVAASFAGATVHISDNKASSNSLNASPKAHQPSQSPSFVDSAAKVMDLQAPGVSFKVEYRRRPSKDPSLNTEIKIDASSNVLHPNVVPLFYEISNSVKQVMADRTTDSDDVAPKESKADAPDPTRAADPAAILGSTRLNLGLRIAKQQFGLTCQPVARVAANAQFEDIYVTVSTVQSQDQGRFFALSASVLKLQTSLQHVYSREPTASFSIERISLSLMNSRHVSDVNGISAILKISPMSLNINAKQMQDFFLFKEIWLPSDLDGPAPSVTPDDSDKAVFGVHKYQEMAATGAFTWNASIYIEKMEVQVDLGQSLGKSAFSILELWMSSRKTSNWEQNLCIRFQKIGVNCKGRLSGFVELQRLQVQSTIHWPEAMRETDRTPLVEASATVGQLQAKLAFEYQAFLIADFVKLEFLMYNVRDSTHASGDRLVCLVEGASVEAFCTTQTSAQCVSLFQAVQRLIQEKRNSYETSLKEVQKFLERKPGALQATLSPLPSTQATTEHEDEHLIPLQLQTNVVVALKSIKVGAYPRTFFDTQIFKLEALDASTHFSVAFKNGQLQSGLGLSLGQVRIALSNLTDRVERKAFEDLEVAEVIRYSTGSRGGTILKVPRLVSEMQTWQASSSYHIDYIFKSSFEGKIEVGWNYSRISYLRGMWANHSRALAQRLGKPLPQSAVQITGGLDPVPIEDGTTRPTEQEKITAVVNVPLSKYNYTALEPPIIDTPQLRDMGEATPPLEWIGLHRDRLPNLTHQIIIVPLLEVAKEVEDAYSTILGSS